MESKYLTMFSDVPAKQVQWLWKPYIPIGKVTLLQGDPNDGKSTMMMNIVSELSKGGAMPDGTALGRPQRIIYQCSEDDASDTIKPRLEACGADCRNIAFINESIYGDLTIDDERLRESIIDFRPRLVVIDPIQAYVENDSDLMSASKARRLMKRTGIWASQYDCAIVVIGHMNKYCGSKDLYRGLGSIDLVEESVFIRGRSREETIYCILNELWRLDDRRPIYVVMSLESWNKLRQLGTEGNVYIPWFFADEITAIENNTNVFVLDENTPVFDKTVLELRPRTRATLAECLKNEGMPYEKVYALLEDTHAIYLEPQYPITARIFYDLCDTYMREADRERKDAENGWN